MASQQQPDDLNNNNNTEDIFESLLNLEETHFNEGYTLGYTDGILSGKQESRPLGIQHGFQAGEELGFYMGCIKVWKAAMGVDPTHFSARTQRKITIMEVLAAKFPILEPENESLQEIMDSLRNEFKAVCHNLHVRLDYNRFSMVDDSQF